MKWCDISNDMTFNDYHVTNDNSYYSILVKNTMRIEIGKTRY